MQHPDVLQSAQFTRKHGVVLNTFSPVELNFKINVSIVKDGLSLHLLRAISERHVETAYSIYYTAADLSISAK